MPLPAATVSALNSFSSIATAQFSLPPKRNLPLSSSHIFSRRDIALLSFFSLSAPASAIDIGICKHTLLQFITSSYSYCILNHNPNFLNRCSAGPKDWLREQKKKSSKFLLAPVDASRESLRSVYLYLSTNFSFLFSYIYTLFYILLGFVCFGSFSQRKLVLLIQMKICRNFSSYSDLLPGIVSQRIGILSSLSKLTPELRFVFANCHHLLMSC